MKDTKAESQMALQIKQEEERRLAAEQAAREQALKKAMDGINLDDFFRSAKCSAVTHSYKRQSRL